MRLDSKRPALEVPPDSLDSASSTGTSINIFVGGVGVGLTHTEDLMIKKLRESRETSGLELDEEEAEPAIWRSFKTDHGQRLHLVRQDKRDLHDSRHELQNETRDRLQERISKRGVSI